MRFDPHNYQRRAIEFILDNPITALLLDMGLGKTVITLTAITELLFNRFEVSRVLVIAPLRVARDTWPAELAKWDHLHHLRASVVVGTATERIEALTTPADIYIINRENVPWLFEQPNRPAFDMLVIDELSSFKSHQTKRFKALTRAREQFTRIIGLTGTPAPNGLGDLWAQFKLLDGGERLLPQIGRFRDRWFRPDKTNGRQVYSWRLRDGAEDEIYNAIDDITISIRSTDHLKLPELTSVQVPVHLNTKARSVYNQLRDQMVLELRGHILDAANAAVLSNKLLQLASGAIYDEDNQALDVHEAKLDALEDFVEAANGKPVLVAFWFRHELARITERFPQARHLTTTTDFERWNTGEIELALIHPASAGHGLNLQTGGSTLIWFTAPWSLELYQQTNARLHRQGQTQPVTILHLCATGTVDEQVLRALEQKNTTQAALIRAVRAELEVA